MDRADVNLDASLLMRCVMRHKLRFLFVFATCFSVITLGMLVMSPSYEVSTVLIGGQPDLEPSTNATKRSSDSGISLAGIAESEEVLRAAIAMVGLRNLVGPAELDTRSIFEKARGVLINFRDTLKSSDLSTLSIRTPTTPDSGADPKSLDDAKLRDDAMAQADAAYTLVSRAVKVKAEPNSDIIRISFRHKDPAVAAAFANALSRAFIERQAAIFSRPGASDFFRAQSARFSTEFKRVSSELKDFMVTSAVYSVEEQRQLLLRRRNDVLLALTATRSTIAEKAAQKVAIVAQLRKLAPVARSPYVSSVVNSMSDDKLDRGAPEPRTPSDLLNGESPLLLVKVYQDSMATLFKVDADLAGMDRIREVQTAELETITRDLQRLASNEYQYLTLKRSVSIAEENALMYEKRMTEEKINAESRAANFLAVKVVQKATPPSSPVFPNYTLVTAMALIVSFLAAVSASALRGLRDLRHLPRHDRDEPRLPRIAA